MIACVYHRTRARHPATRAVYASRGQAYWGAAVCDAHLPRARAEAERWAGARAQTRPLQGADSGALFDMPEVTRGP